MDLHFQVLYIQMSKIQIRQVISLLFHVWVIQVHMSKIQYPSSSSENSLPGSSRSEVEGNEFSEVESDSNGVGDDDDSSQINAVNRYISITPSTDPSTIAQFSPNTLEITQVQK